MAEPNTLTVRYLSGSNANGDQFGTATYFVKQVVEELGCRFVSMDDGPSSFHTADFSIGTYSDDGLIREEFENPPPGYIVFNFLGETDMCMLRFGDVMWEGRLPTPQMRDALRKLFARHLARRRGAQDEHWDQSTEVFIRHLDLLLNQRDALEAELGRVYRDRDVARARVEELELLLQTLQREHGGTKGKKDKSVIVALVMGVAAILGPIGPRIVDHLLVEPVAQVTAIAQDVQADCGVVVNGNSITYNFDDD